MSAGKNDICCNKYRPWKGQEPLCGNCAWNKEDHKKLWKKYRFTTKAKDFRPIIFNEKYPWWCSGYDSDGNAIIIAFLPMEEDLKKYWDDAFDISSTEEYEITFSDRFPKPPYFSD
jgi:hypothetical protein